jgi:hypothetical protein
MSGLSFVVDPEDGSAEAGARARRAERALRDIHEVNNLDQLEFDNEIDCSVLGDAAYKVTWDAAEKRVRISAPDVQGLFVWLWGDDASWLWRVASRYVLGHEETEMLYGPLPGSSRTKRSEHTIVEVWTDEDFELWIDGAPFESRENPYGFIPFVIYPNVREPKQFWGVSDLIALKEPLRELNRSMSQPSLILELSGNPIAVPRERDRGAGHRGEAGALSGRSRRRRALTCLTCSRAAARGCTSSFAGLLRTLHDLAGVPRSAFGETKHALSGVALQMELDPLMRKVERKRLIRGSAFRRPERDGAAHPRAVHHASTGLPSARLGTGGANGGFRALPIARRLGAGAAAGPLAARRG